MKYFRVGGLILGSVGNQKLKKNILGLIIILWFMLYLLAFTAMRPVDCKVSFRSVHLMQDLAILSSQHACGRSDDARPISARGRPLTPGN